MANAVVEWQLVTPDPEGAARFYEALFGWSIAADNPLGYRRVESADGAGIPGGIWPAPPEANAFVQLFVAVPDVGAAVADAERLGARIVIPPQVLPDGDRMAVIADPQDVPLGLVERTGPYP